MSFVERERRMFPRYRRAFLIVLLPLIILFWIVGWMLFWTGNQTKSTEQLAEEIVIQE